MERPPLRYLKPTPGKTFRTLNEAEIEATVKNNLTLAAALLANRAVASGAGCRCRLRWPQAQAPRRAAAAAAAAGTRRLSMPRRGGRLVA